MEEKYSVLMAVYYKENPEYLQLAIQSMLNQTIFPDEFIIVKDGPIGDNLEKVISKFCSAYPGLFNILSNDKNMGLGPALRKGIIAAKNEMIARMDSDDFSMPDRCRIQMEYLINDCDLGMIGSYESEFIDTIENVVAIHRVPDTNDKIKKFMKRRCAVLHPTVMYRKSAVIQSGNYQETSIYNVYEDYDLFARMVFDSHIKCYNIQESLYFIRTSEDFYERRGGLKYAKTVLRFKWHLFRKRNMSFFDFCISGLGQAFVCVLPNALRKEIYIKILRN